MHTLSTTIIIPNNLCMLHAVVLNFEIVNDILFFNG